MKSHNRIASSRHWRRIQIVLQHLPKDFNHRTRRTQFDLVCLETLPPQLIFLPCFSPVILNQSLPPACVISLLRISTDTLLLKTVVPKGGPRTRRSSITGSILEMQAQESHPNLLNQKLYNTGSSDCILISCPGHSDAH